FSGFRGRERRGGGCRKDFGEEGGGEGSEVETREDEEQNIKLIEILELLVAAGYFRARIKGLSPFDKVVGGMTWCITTCSVDIDVDLLFQENSTIGQKIALTEKIVSVLPKMKCPHRLEPHQIQGLDFIHIFPVVQWLVKRAIETREEMGDYIRSYSISQFQKTHRLPEDDEFMQRKEKAIKTVTDIFVSMLDFDAQEARLGENDMAKMKLVMVLELDMHVSISAAKGIVPYSGSKNETDNGKQEKQ
ncbi:PREDICTED: coiled-coil domain-containing protein 93-like, partial [Leptosomus discolor]|uniref:coiled-coil domain-containing protein 93-like n=1 Tax=Leptosomus discolor TaxID=188344 RepID=UPI000522B29D